VTTRRTSRLPARVLAVVALAAPFAGTLLAVTATPASAAQSTKVSFDVASDGDILTAPKDIKATGTITNTGSTTSGGTLALDGPADSAGNAFHSGTTIPGCSVPVLANSCSKSVSATFAGSQMSARSNGYWTAAVGSSSKSFWTSFDPTTTPGDVAAHGTSPAPGASAGTVDVTWTYSGSEPDLWGFRVEDSIGNVSDVARSDAGCSGGGTCSFTEHYDNPTPGTYNYGYDVKALRSSGGCPGCATYTVSAKSAGAGATLVTPQPPPSPTPSPSSGSGTTGGTTTGGTTTGGTTTGGTTTGGTTGSTTGSGSHSTTGSTIVVPTLNPIANQRKNFALKFNSFAPSLGIPKLPPLPATSFPVTLPGEQQYQPTLPYTAPTPQPQSTSTKLLSAPLDAFRSLDTQQLAKDLAMALILLVAAAHLRLFISSHKGD
jgi:hypothetical protein